MVDGKEKTKVNHGRNIRTIRYWRNLSQSELGDLLGDKIQCQISQLERKKQIDKKILEEVARVLRVDVELLDTFDPEGLMEGRSYEQHNKEVENAVIAEDYLNNSLPFSEMKKMFDEIRRLDRQIADMRCLLAQHGIEYDPDQK